MNSWIKSYYRELRADGMSASHALHAAKTIDRFHDLENERLVRIIADRASRTGNPAHQGVRGMGRTSGTSC